MKRKIQQKVTKNKNNNIKLKYIEILKVRA